MPFPELIKEGSGSDVIIRLEKINLSSSDICSEKIVNDCIVQEFNNCTYLIWNDITICKICNGTEILVNSSTGLEENFLASIILDTAFGILLHQKGRLIFHASAVNMNDGAVVFLGPSGNGKSTTALTLYKKDYNLLSDDMVSISLNKDEFPLLFPSFPRMKLWPSVIKNINEDPESMHKLHFNTIKRFYSIINKFPQTSIPIKAIYLIEKSNKTIIEEISPKDSLFKLINNSYFCKIFDNDDFAENLKQCAKLVNDIPIKRLKIEHCFENLHEIVKVIENDIKDNI